MRRILSIFKRDMYSSLRDFILLYIIVAPILLTIGLRFFIPSAQSAALQFALHEELGTEVIKEFNKYGSVEVFSSVQGIKDRVNQIDDIAGIVKNENGIYGIILEGNESHDTKEIPKKIIRDIEGKKELDINYVISDIGFKMSPVALIGSISMILMSILIGGVIIGLNIIEEKESMTMKALNVTPMGKFEFIAGKSLVGILLPIVHVFIILGILNMLNVDKLMILAMTLSSSLLALLVGFLIGVMSSNQIAGIANLKLILTLVSLTIVGAILLPESKHFLLYWAPTYWSFIGFKGIILRTITWARLGIYIAWILMLNVLIFAILRNKIRKGLT